MRVAADALLDVLIVPVLNEYSQEFQRIDLDSRRAAQLRIDLIQFAPAPTLVIIFLDDDARKIAFHHRNIKIPFHPLLARRRLERTLLRASHAFEANRKIFIGVKTKGPQKPRPC